MGAEVDDDEMVEVMIVLLRRYCYCPHRRRPLRLEGLIPEDYGQHMIRWTDRLSEWTHCYY